MVRAWRIALPAGLASLLGSICWFTAFALQTVAYVNGLGQVELVFSLLASVLIFGERVTPREGLGVAVLTGSIIVLVLVT